MPPKRAKKKRGRPYQHEIVPDSRFEELVKKGLTISEIARELSLTPSSVYERLHKLRLTATKAIVKSERQIERAVDTSLNAVEQLQKINRHANWLLDHLMRWIQGDDEAIQVLEKQARRVKVGSKDDPKWVTEYKFKDPHTVALSAMSEIREQLKLQLDMFKTFYSFQAIQEFMRVVLDAINSVDPATRDRIITELNRCRAMGPTHNWFTGARGKPRPEKSA